MKDNPWVSPRYLAATLVIVFILCHSYLVNAPPNGYHQWRESDTAAIALNYYQEDFTFLHPRLNQRGAGEGITGMEFPIYCFTMAALYQIFGVHHLIPRLLTLLLSLAGLWGFYRLLRSRFQDETVAAFGVVALAFSPLFFFYSFKIMPDISMLSLAMLSVYCYDQYLSTGKYVYIISSAGLLVLSAVLKPMGLTLLLPLAYITWRAVTLGTKRFIVFTVYAIVTTILTLLWYAYARQVNAVYGTPGFYLGETFWSFPDYWFTAFHFKKEYLQWFPELWIGWTLVPAFLAGAYLTVQRKFGGFFWLWFIAGAIAIGLTATASTTQDYYSLIITPAVAAITGLGLAYLWKFGTKGRFLVIFLCIITPVVTCVRVYHRFDRNTHFDAIRRDADQYIPRDALVMVEETTTAVRLYQLNRHGWPIRFGVTRQKLQPGIESGAKYMVLEQPLSSYDTTLMPLFDTAVTRIDSLYCYRIKKGGE